MEECWKVKEWLRAFGLERSRKVSSEASPKAAFAPPGLVQPEQEEVVGAWVTSLVDGMRCAHRNP